MLARFSALAQQAKEEKQHEEEEKERLRKLQEEEEERERSSSEWYQQMKSSSSSGKVEADVETTETAVRKVDKTDLVWAPSPFKGNSFAMSRVCEHGEGALATNIDWPIPEDHVLVEHFALPKTMNPFSVIKPTKKPALERCLPFNSPLHAKKKQSSIVDAMSGTTSSSEHNEWDPDRLNEFYVVLKKKFSVSQSKKILANCKRVADEFLRLALEKKKKEEVYEEIRAEADSLTESNPPVPRVEETEDMSKYALKKDTEGKRRRLSVRERTLQAGDVIGYQCKIFKQPRKSEIIRIAPGACNPLTLANDDIIYSTDLIVKYDRNANDESMEYLESMQLSDYRLLEGEVVEAETTQQVVARQTKADLKRIAEKTGVTLNTSITSRKRAKRSTD